MNMWSSSRFHLLAVLATTLFLLPGIGHSFSIPSKKHNPSTTVSLPSPPPQSKVPRQLTDISDTSTAPSSLLTTRRKYFTSIIKGSITSIILASTIPEYYKNEQAAFAANELGTKDHPIAIIGGGGRTGMSVAEALAGRKSGSATALYTVTMTRSAKDPFQIIKLPPETKEKLTFYDQSVDVRYYDSIISAFQATTPSVVVYAASASKQGGNSFQVDDEGVANVAKACKAIGSQLILISALAVDRPESKSFKITNTIGGYMDKIMDAKLNGENSVKKIMGEKDYVIIRPGVLLNGKSRNGASDIELNQGDTIGGGISRDELAGVVVGAIQNGKRGYTVEAYRKSTATKLQPEFVIPSGNELTASTYKDLFNNVKENL